MSQLSLYFNEVGEMKIHFCECNCRFLNYNRLSREQPENDNNNDDDNNDMALSNLILFRRWQRENILWRAGIRDC